MVSLRRMPDETEVLSFKTQKSKKRLAKILAAKMNFADVSALMNFLLEREISRNFSEATQRELLSGAVRDEDEGTAAKKEHARRRKAA